jgi:hypothetical protein
MTIAAAMLILQEIIDNLPAAISTGEEVIKLVNQCWNALQERIKGTEVTPEEISKIVSEIVANTKIIDSL